MGGSDVFTRLLEVPTLKINHRTFTFWSVTLIKLINVGIRLRLQRNLYTL